MKLLTKRFFTQTERILFNWRRQ